MQCNKKGSRGDIGLQAAPSTEKPEKIDPEGFVHGIYNLKGPNLICEQRRD